MNLINLSIDDIKPYKKNARKNDKAVKYVAESIKEFGFKSPIILDKDNVIICGHTRYKASKKLGLKDVPCIIADDLTDEQVKAYRLADNKVSEIAEWDDDLLSDELSELLNIDMSDFGFDIGDILDDTDINTDDEEKENERTRTGNAYKLEEYDETRCEGLYNMPILKPCFTVPSDLIGFNYAKSTSEYDTGIHFFIDDYQFERLWNDTYSYIDLLNKFECILTCDFSLYLNMPIALQVYNIYRSRLIGQIYQDNGINVIPTVSWSKKDSFEFCFDGLPHNSVLAVSTIGVKQDANKLAIWKDGMDEMIKRLTPKTILVYGGQVDYDYKNTKVIYYSNKVTERMKGA